jgi:ribose transport system substrate-binding protein
MASEARPRTTRRRARRLVPVALVALVAAALAVTTVGAAGGAVDEAAKARATVSTQLKQLIAQSSRATKTEFPALRDSPCRKIERKTGDLVVGYSYAGRLNTWQVQNGDGGVWYLENHPLVEKVYATDGQEDPSKQISDIQSLISRGVDLLIVNPATMAVSPAVQQACNRGIPVIPYDRFVTPQTNVTASMYADEVQDGYNSGKGIVQALKGKGNVVILGGIPGNGVTENRIKGARLAFSEASGVKVLATGYSNYDPATGRKVMEQWLTKYRPIDAVWSDSGVQAVGVFQALEAAGRLKEVKMIAGGQFNNYLRLCVQKKVPCYGSTISTDVGILAAQLGIDIVTGKTPLPRGNVVAPLVVIPPAKVKTYYRADLPDSYWATLVLPRSVLGKIYKTK